MISRDTILRNENIIWIIYVILAIIGIYANNLEIDDIKNNSNKNKNKYKGINIIVLITVIIVYIYFVYITFSYIKKKKSLHNLLLFIGSILVLISGILFLIVEIISDDVIIPNE